MAESNFIDYVKIRVAGDRLTCTVLSTFPKVALTGATAGAAATSS